MKVSEHIDENPLPKISQAITAMITGVDVISRKINIESAGRAESRSE